MSQKSLCFLLPRRFQHRLWSDNESVAFSPGVQKTDRKRKSWKMRERNEEEVIESELCERKDAIKKLKYPIEDAVKTVNLSN